MSIEGENRELLFQELYNMVGYHLAKYGQMPSLLFDDENPKSSDPTKHVEYDENDGKIVIHTGRFKMKEADIKERLREGFKCDIGVDGHTESAEFGFTPTPKDNSSIPAESLNGYLTCDRMMQLSPERQKKYYTEKKTPLKDRNQEDGNERLEELFSGEPNKGPGANSNSVQNIMNRFGNNVGSQQPVLQPSVGQQPEEDIWLTDNVPYNEGMRNDGFEKMMGFDVHDGQAVAHQDVCDAVRDYGDRWVNNDFEVINLREAALRGRRGYRRSMALQQ